MNVLPRRRNNQGNNNNAAPVTPQAQRVVLGHSSGGWLGSRAPLGLTGQQRSRVLSLVGSAPQRPGMVGASGGIPQRRVALLISNNSDDFDDSFDNIHFQENRNAILHNFEEWIRMATDNKINLKNTWSLGLIEYFSDMNVIMDDGNRVNFQKASATLDGCMKIYTSRVDSAAFETGKLLSGLAKKPMPQDEDDADGSDDEDADENTDEAKKRPQKKKDKGPTLVKDFDAIRVKKLEQELSIDPLFKKALAEFDEGGAKSLLLNTLSIDKHGRVVFSATLSKEDEQSADVVGEEPEDEEMPDAEDPPLDPQGVDRLKQILFKNGDLDELTLCPSFGEFKQAIDDFSRAKLILLAFNDKIEAANLTVNLERPPAAPEPLANDLEGQGGDDYAGFDDAGFHDDEPHQDAFDDEGLGDALDVLFKEPEEPNYQGVVLSKSAGVEDRDLMVYFDERLNANWRGPEHWKVALINEARRKAAQKTQPTTELTPGSRGVTPVPKRQPPKPLMIDFFGPEPDEDELFRPPRQTPRPKMPLHATDTLLPNDIRYNSQRLTNLFTKPQMLIRFGRNRPNRSLEPVLTDERYFAEQYEAQRQEEEDRERQLAALFHQAEYEDYNHDFDDGIDFNDVLAGALEPDKQDEHINPITRRKRDMITFSRVAKRVDIKQLKDNIWYGMKTEAVPLTPPRAHLEDVNPPPILDKPLRFNTLVDKVANMYDPESRKDLSTSFYFICMLHLANEHGLEIKSTDDLDDLEITGIKMV